jgi:hypothetical protein
MPHATRGVIARWALRRKIPGEPILPVHDLDRYIEGYSSWSGSETYTRLGVRRFKKRNYFIQHSSGFRVERGRLGEVESLVGDCRPPPPDNPPQPSTGSRITRLSGGLRKKPFLCNSFIIFIPKWQINRGASLSMCRYLPFKKIYYPYNLKYINQFQYFKNDCSYSSCVEQCTVLEFVRSHYHLYGFRLVGSPSIAITNVLII